VVIAYFPACGMRQALFLRVSLSSGGVKASPGRIWGKWTWLILSGLLPFPGSVFSATSAGAKHLAVPLNLAMSGEKFNSNKNTSKLPNTLLEPDELDNSLKYQLGI
jgi:hypothetical protein